MTTPGPLSPNMVNAASGIIPSIINGPPPNGATPYYSLGVSPAFQQVMGQYNALPQISKYKIIYDEIAGVPSYSAALLPRWNGLQLGSWPALTDGATYSGISDFAGGPAPVNSWSLTAYSDDPLSDAGPPLDPPPTGWRVPFSPRNYYATEHLPPGVITYEPDARYQTQFLLTNARLVMGFSNPRDRIPVAMEDRDLTKFAQIQAICDAYRGQANTMVNSSANSEIIAPTFTGMESLSTSGVSLVSTTPGQFGGDLENLGDLINLRNLDFVGYPSSVFKQMLAAGGLLPGVYDALLLSGLTEPEIFLLNQNRISIELNVELKLYQALMMIQNENLDQVIELLDINPSSVSLSTAADLVNPKKILPTTYQSLIVQKPAGNGQVENVNVYLNGTINTSISDLFVDDEKYINLRKIIPEDQALANSALIRGLKQVKNITNLDFRDFSVATAALEDITDLNDVNSLSSPVPADPVQNMINACLATGTGPNDSLTMYDLIGTAAGAVHKDNFEKTIEQMSQIDFTELISLYDLCLEVIDGVYDVNYFSITAPVLTSGGSGYTSASATTTAPTGDYCQSTPTFNVTVAAGNVTGITATSLGSGFRDTDFPVTITISGDGTNATATTTKGAEKFAFVELPDGRQFEACDDEIAGRLKALEALIYSGSGGDNGLPGPWNTIELEAKRLVNTYPDQVSACNTYWSEMAEQMNREALNRYLAELVFDFSTATYPDIKPYSRSFGLAMINGFHSYGIETSKDGTADFFNAVAQQNFGGESVIASLREGRNIEALVEAGVGIDTQIPPSAQTT